MKTIPFDAKLLAHNQLIGTSGGYALFRDLYEMADGERISVPTSREFDSERERTLPDGRLVAYPSQETMFNRHRL